MYTYFKDAQVAIIFTIKNVETQNLIDPSEISVELKVYGSEGSILEETIYDYGTSPEITRTSLGTYKVLHTPTEYGKLVYGITTTNPAGFYASAIVIKDNSI